MTALPVPLPVPLLVVAVPLAAAALLGALPSPRLAARLNVAAATLTFLLACLLPGHRSPPGALIAADPLAVHIALLSAFVGLTSAAYSAGYVRVELAAARLDARRLRLYHAMFQALLGFVLLALLADNTGLTWVAIEAATIASALVVALPRSAEAIEASWKFFILCGVGVSLALFGTIVLYLAAEPALGPGPAAMRWSALGAAGPRCNGVALNLAFVFLLMGYGTKAALAPLHAWMPDAHAEGPTPVSAVLSGAVLNVSLLVILRLRHLMDASWRAGAGAIAPGPPIMALGILSVLLAALSLWRRRDVKRFFAFSTIEQSGLAAYAFGLGATYAGLLHLTLHTLAKAAVYHCVGRAAQQKGGQRFADIGGLSATGQPLGLTLAAGIVAVAGLPPFGLFASEFLVLTETVRRAPLLALPLAAGLLIGAWALVSRLQGLCLGPPTSDRGPAPPPLALLPAWAHLALVLLLGLAMPAPVAAWMRGLAP